MGKRDMNYSKKKMKKKQKLGNASRKIYKKNHRRLRKSAKNKQSTNLLFKTVKLYQKQKHKYLDKPKHQTQNGGNNPIFKGGNKPIKLSADDIIDKERRKAASQDQVIKKLLRDLKDKPSSSKNSPEFTFKIPKIISRKVDFPDPEIPTIPTNSFL